MDSGSNNSDGYLYEVKKSTGKADTVYGSKYIFVKVSQYLFGNPTGTLDGGSVSKRSFQSTYGGGLAQHLILV